MKDGNVRISDYGKYDKGTLLMLLTEEARAGCHDDLTCYCSIRERIVEITKQLGPLLSETLWVMLCNSCTSADRTRSLTNGGGGVPLSSYRLFTRDQLFSILIVEVNSGCHDDLLCYCAIKEEVFAIDEALGGFYGDLFWDTVCRTCGVPQTPTPPALPPIAPPVINNDKPPPGVTCPISTMDPNDFLAAQLVLSKDSA